MSEATRFLACAVLIGTGATVTMDLWTAVQKRLLGVRPLDYVLVGRWLAWLARGRFRHDPIGATPPVRGERLIGWTAHYLIGIAFATLLLGVWGIDWARRPAILPALIVGIGGIAAPFLLMQPAMGFGIAASRTPRPAAARLRSLITHTVFGLGLYASGLIASAVGVP